MDQTNPNRENVNDPASDADENSIGLANRLMNIGKDCADHLKEPVRSADHADLFYDESGLPSNQE